MLLPDQKERNWAMWFHIGVLVLVAITSWAAGVAGAIAALVVYLLNPLNSPFIREHAREAFNFNATFFLLAVLGMIVAVITFGLGFIVIWPVWVILGIVWVVCTVLAAIAAQQGTSYHFPLAIPFLRR